jgi:hypothetical protein
MLNSEFVLLVYLFYFLVYTGKIFHPFFLCGPSARLGCKAISSKETPCFESDDSAGIEQILWHCAGAV